MKKPRSDSLFARLSEASEAAGVDLKRQVVEWAREHGTGYAEILKRLKDDYGIESSEGALSNFVQRHSLGWRLDTAMRAAEALGPQLPTEIGAHLKRAAQSNIMTLLFEELSAEEAVKVARLAHAMEKDERALAIAEQRLAIVQEQHAAAMAQIAAAKGAATDTTLTPEERERRIKEIFGAA